MKRTLFLLLCLSCGFVTARAQSKHSLTSRYPTYEGRVMCGYQGWFRAEGDGTGAGWSHYGVRGKFDTNNLHLDFWADVSEYPKTYPTAFQFADGKPAQAFSSIDESTTDLHFKWMQAYGVDGVFMQRFFGVTRTEDSRRKGNVILGNALKASQKYGRAIAVMYDLSGLKDKGEDCSSVIEDWKQLVDAMKITSQGTNQTYLYHRGKPLVAIWGLGFPDRSYNIRHIGIEKLIDFLKNDPQYGGCSVMLGVPTYFRDSNTDCLPDPYLHEVMASADVVMPWTVQRFTPLLHNDTERYAAQVKADLAWCAARKLDYAPCVCPGFSWFNLSKVEFGGVHPLNQIPRQKGKFYWNQISAAQASGGKMLYVAMFDEMDEGTAIFKCSNQLPVGAKVLDYEGLPTDHYLWLTGEAGKMLRGEIPSSRQIPDPGGNQIAIMKKFLTHLLIASAFLAGGLAQAQVEYVDPTIGGQGFLLEPTKPTVHLPNSMVRVYPVRKDQLDDQIKSFPLTIISHRLGELFWIMPHDGSPTGAWDRPAAWDQEVTTPYYYSTRFDDSLIQTEFTPTERCGYFRFSFPSGKAAVVLANRFPGNLSVGGSNSVSGEERFNNMKAFFYGEFSAPVQAQSTGSEKKRLTVSSKEAQKNLEFRYGVSFISIEQAKKNLQKEIPTWGFEKVKRAAKDRWNETLGQIKVEGGTESQRKVFYTSLYRCYERMVNITENGQYYSAFDHKVHQDARPFYVDNWLWDTYRALEPLHTLLNPEREADQIQSYVRMYEQTGWMPSFAVLWGDYPCMTGNHAAAWFADAWFKGVRNFDIKKAYEGVRKNSLDATILPWRNGPKTSLDEFHAEHGYLPALKPDEKETVTNVHHFERRQSVAVTLEQSYDDWCTAQLAKAAGVEADYPLFMKRASFYKNVFRQDKNSVWPKDAEGNWIEPFDPKFSGGQGGRDYTTENNAYTYDWDVQHDLSGLFELMGGRAKAEAKLDQLFREGLDRSKYDLWFKFPDASGLVGQFSMGNEPSFHIPYLYNHLGAPWKTQKRIRMLLETWFPDTLLGIPGDEDGGGMTAFVVFSMMGFYPVVPGVPTYDIGSPVFDRITINLHSGKTLRIVAKNNSRDNKYVQSIRLNSKPLENVWFRHADIVNGGTLELEMGNTPNRAFGADATSLPPSAMSLDPVAYTEPAR